jgi:hypothetical protein
VASYVVMKTPRHHITVEQARAVQLFNPGAWTIQRTPEGWICRKGDALLVGINTRKPRVFKTTDGAIKRLKAEAGATEFRVLETA